MTEDEQIMTALINRRGYLVVASRLDFAPGEGAETARYGDFGGRRLETENRLSVLARTNYADFIAQHELIIRLGWFPNTHPEDIPSWKFYRVTTD